MIDGTILLGCTIGVISSATQSVGITLQRKSHIIEDSRPAGTPRQPAHRQTLWRVGLLLFLISNVFGSSVQITTLPIVILSPLQAVGLVFNSVCASLILAEPFTQFSLIGTVLVSTGALLIAAYGAVPEPSHNLKELLLLLRRPVFLSWMAVTFLVIALLYAAIQVKERLDEARNTNSLTTKGILYGVISGILSAHSLLMAKSAVELLVRAFSDQRWGDLLEWQTWLIVGAFLFFALSQLYILNCGLRLCSTSVLYPLVFCVYNITAILNGLIYFEQTSRLSSRQIFLVVLGTALVLVGVLSLSWRLDKSSMQSYKAVMQQSEIGHRRQLSRLSENGEIIMEDSERTPLLVDTDANSQQYTSFRSLTNGGAGIPEPVSPYSAAGNRRVKVRTLSLEQSEIMEQLRRNRQNYDTIKPR